MTNSISTPSEPFQPVKILRTRADPTPVLDAIGAYQKTPSPDTGRKALEALGPDIQKGLARYAADDPIARGRAKKIILDALPRYDPQAAQPSTFVDRQLQGLQRWQTRRAMGGRVPVRFHQERRAFEQKVTLLDEELGRTPTLSEIQDRTGLSLSQVRRLRRPPSVLPGSTIASQGEDADGLSELGDQVAKQTDPYEGAAMLLREDLPPRDQLIMEHTIGLAGAQRLGVAELAKRLNVSPGYISQRRGVIQAQLDELVDLNPFNNDG